jgi:cell wall assembly regulator SMI1
MAGGRAPERPAGEPKPLLREDLTPILARLDTWYATHLPQDRYIFNPPAEQGELDALERLVGIALPDAYRQLYRWHDGENDDRWGHFYGLPLLPLHRTRSEWSAWNDIGGDRYAVPAAAWPEGTVDPAYSNPRWIPLTSDGSGNHIGLDLDPWPDGRIGQIILFGRDEDVKIVLAESLGTFLEWIVKLLESGNFRLEVEPDEQILRRFRLKTPALNDFHLGARIILGAPGPLL